MKHYFYQALEENPIIAAIKTWMIWNFAVPSGRDPSGIRPVRRYLYDPDDRKTPKGRWEDRNRACRPDRGLKQQRRSWWTSLKCRQRQMGSLVQRSH